MYRMLPVLFSLMLAAGAVQAQQATSSAQASHQDAQMAQAARKVVQMVDAGQIATLWDGASVVAKKAVTRDGFVKQIDAERTRLGKPLSRGEGTVTHVKYGAGAQVPEGEYANISFPTRFANAAQPVRELVSFRLDEDKTWRLSGYSVRMPTH